MQLASQRLGALDGRQVSLQDTIALSLEHLPQTTIEAFTALGAFAARPATFDLAAAKAVAQADAATLATLVARSLVEQAGPETLALHQTIADFTRTRMPEPTCQRHRDYYLALVDRDRADWQRIQEIYPQAEHAWAWVDGRTLDERLDFLYAIKDFAYLRGLWEPVRRRAEELLSHLQETDQRPQGQAVLLNELGYICSALGDQAQALAFYEQALPLRRQVSDKAGEATTHNNLGAVYATQDDRAQADQHFREAQRLYRQVKDKRGEATTLDNLGLMYDTRAEDDADKKKPLSSYKQALRLYRQVDDKRGEATTLTNTGLVYAALDNKKKALGHFEKALPLYQQVGDKRGEAITHINLGVVYDALGDKTQADRHFREALSLYRQVHDKRGEAATLNNLGTVCAAWGDRLQADQFFEEALKLYRQVNDKDGQADTQNNLTRLGDCSCGKPLVCKYFKQTMPIYRELSDKGG